MSAPVGTQAVDRAAALLTAIVESGSRSFTSLVDELGLAKSTTSRLLQALEHSRLVQRDGSGAYRPGLLFADYAARNAAVHELAELVQPALERIGERTGETVNLAVPRGTSVVQISQVDSRYLLGATNWVGMDVPAHCSAAGKVFYAYGAMELPSGRLDRRTAASLGTRTELDRDLATVQQQGYAVTWEELEAGLAAVAAPLRASDGSVVAAVSVSGPITRITRRKAASIGGLLDTELRKVSTTLGYNPGKEGAA